MIFNFLKDFGTYESRKVARDEFDWGFISTAAVSDGSRPYETAVEKNGYMVIVEAYDTKEQAHMGHLEWLIKMTDPNGPPKLKDCSNSGIQQLIDMIEGQNN